MTEELYKEIDLIISDLTKNNFIVTNKGTSKLYDQGVAFLKSKGLIKQEGRENRYVANSDDIYFIKNIGIKKYLDETNRIKELELKITELTADNLEYQVSLRERDEQVRDLTRDNLRLNNWDIRYRWLISIITFLAGFVVKYFMDN